MLPLQTSCVSSELVDLHSQQDRRSSSDRGWTEAFFSPESTSSTISASCSTMEAARPAPFSDALTVGMDSLSASFHFPEHMRHIRSTFLIYLAYTPLPSGKRCQVVVLPVSQRCLVPTFCCQAVEKLLVNGWEVKTVKQLAQGLPVHHVVVLDVLQQTLLQGRALAEHAVD